MGRAISQFNFSGNLPTIEQLYQEMKNRTGLDLKLSGFSQMETSAYAFINCEGFREIELDINTEDKKVSVFYDMVFSRFYKKGRTSPYLYVVLEAVLQDLGAVVNAESPEWARRKWADIGWLMRRREIYK